MKTKRILAGLVALALCGAIAIAGSVYDRVKVTTAVVTGAATWTNNVQDANLQLVRIAAPHWLVTDTITVARVTGDTTYTCTNTIATITNTTAGGAVYFTLDSQVPIYMKGGDMLKVTSAASTGGVLYVEYLVQRH